MAVPALTQSNIATISKRQPVLAVQVWGPNCPHCQASKGMWEAIAKDSEVPLFQLNAAKAPAISKRWRIRGVPAFVLVRQGKVVSQFQGRVSEKALRSWLKKQR